MPVPPFLPGAVIKAAGKAVGRAGGNVKKMLAGETKPGLKPEEFQTDVTAGEDPDLDKPGIKKSVIQGLPTVISGVQGAFDRAARRGQSRLDEPQEAAPGPISRIIGSFGE